jgi:hypothetical protein
LFSSGGTGARYFGSFCCSNGQFFVTSDNFTRDAHHIFQIVESNASAFALDRKITPERIEEVILQSIEKLIEKDSPSLEM